MSSHTFLALAAQRLMVTPPCASALGDSQDTLEPKGLKVQTFNLAVCLVVNLCLLYGALGTSQGVFTQSSGLCSRPPARPFHVLEKIVNPATMREKSLLTLLRIPHMKRKVL